MGGINENAPLRIYDFEGNVFGSAPDLEYAKYVIFHGNDELTIDRPPKFGGSLSFDTYSELEQEYRDAKIHPEDLKNSVATKLNSMIDPIRKHLSDYEKLLQ